MHGGGISRAQGFRTSSCSERDSDASRAANIQTETDHFHQELGFHCEKPPSHHEINLSAMGVLGCLLTVS